jgi:outer membrane lipoprotein-sorting protein
MREPIFLMAIFALVSCTHLKPKQPDPGLTPQQFWKEQTERKQHFEKISGKLSLSLKTKNESVSGNGRVLADFPNSFRLELRDPFGRTQYILLFSHGKLQAYYPVDKVLYEDTHSGKTYLKKMVGIEEDFFNFEALWLGILPKEFHNSKFEHWEWDSSEGVYVGTLRSKEGRLHCSVDGKTSSITKITLEKSDKIVEINYSDFEKEDQITLGHVVKLIIPDAESKVEVEWEEIKTISNIEQSAFELTLPKDVRKVEYK